MKDDKTLKEVKLTHEIINFRCPAKLKFEFDIACGKEERTISQQLRVLMAQYIAMANDEMLSPKEEEKAVLNHSDHVLTKFIQQKKNSKRAR